MRVWFHVANWLSPELILDKFGHVWFYGREEFRIDFELKQLWVAFALDKKFYTEFYYKFDFMIKGNYYKCQ